MAAGSDADAANQTREFLILLKAASAGSGHFPLQIFAEPDVKVTYEIK
jgi:hypothetical protein